MFSLLHRLIVSLHKTSIYRQEPQVLILHCLICFFDSQSGGSHLLAFHESPRTTARNLLYCLLKKKVIYILNGQRVSKLTANVHFSVNYLLKYLWMQIESLSSLPLSLPGWTFRESSSRKSSVDRGLSWCFVNSVCLCSSHHHPPGES